MMQGEEGGNTFHCVTTDIHPVLKQATEAANGKDIRFGGGVATIRQYLRAGLIDESHVVLTPLVLGSGEHLFSDLDVRNLGHQCTDAKCDSHRALEEGEAAKLLTGRTG